MRFIPSTLHAASAKRELALADHERRDCAAPAQALLESVERAQGEAKASRLARDKAIGERDRLRAELSRLNETIRTLREQVERAEIMKQAETASLVAKNRLMQEELRAQQAVITTADGLHSVAPFTALRDSHAAELQLAQLQGVRIAEERDDAERECRRCALSCPQGDFKRGNVPNQVHSKCSSLQLQVQGGR
jgi:chromosome segregation ATPase